MVQIFKEYLHKACDSIYYSRLSVTAPNSIKEHVNFQFWYHFRYKPDYVMKQAAVFADEVFSRPKLTEIVNRNLNGSQRDKRDTVTNLYLYSYLKTFNFCVRLQETNGDSAGNPMANSVAFGGHVEMFKSFYDTFQIGISSTSHLNSSLSRYIEITDYDVDDFKQSAFFNDFKFGNKFFYRENIEYERLLDAFQHFAKDEIWIAEYNLENKLDAYSHPLGNACFDAVVDDCDSVFVANNPDMVTDSISRFWNTANCVYINSYKMDGKFDRDRNIFPYAIVECNVIPDEVMYAEVQAITGINSGAKYSTYGSGRYGGGTLGGSPRPTKPGPNKPGGNDSNSPDNNSTNSTKSNPTWGSTKNKGGGNKPKDGGDGNGFIAKAKNAVIKGTEEGIKLLGEIAKDDESRRTILKLISDNQNKKQEALTYTAVPIDNVVRTTTLGSDYLPFKQETVKTEFLLR